MYIYSSLFIISGRQMKTHRNDQTCNVNNITSASIYTRLTTVYLRSLKLAATASLAASVTS